MSTPNGYNNPAYCHQFDTSLYDYEYVPEIDPDSPEPNQRRRDDIKLVRPRYQPEFSVTSDEFDNSSDSNKSIIVEECNNRRITLICERRKPENGTSGYYQDVCLESERPPEVPLRSDRHQRRLEPPRESLDNAITIPRRLPRVHRYEEIPPPPYSRSVHRYAEISTDENGYPSMEQEVEVESMNYPQSFSPNFSPSRTYQRTISPHPPDLCHFRPTSPNVYTSSPRQNIEMSELSPPKAVIRTPKRSHPKPSPERFVVSKNSPRRNEKFPDVVCNSTPKAKIVPVKKSTPKDRKQHPIRRNISNSFTEPKNEKRFSPFKSDHPYKPTTKEVPSKTAIITPILQRKNELFQSTGNILQNPVDRTIMGMDGKVYQISEGFAGKLKRNQSVPNFIDSPKRDRDHHQSTPKKSAKKLEYHYSPTKSIDRFSPIDRSRLSLIDQSKSSWSNLGSEFRSPPTGCLSVAAIFQIMTGVASSAISFYLLSKMGRRYYLDLGVLASFMSIILGVLGFRAHCWRWFPNRNYVSGYIMLAVFSILTCSGLVFLITARPMSGDPMLDLAGGAICGISVLTIIMAITGLTMSSCCKTPPPDNRVTNI